MLRLNELVIAMELRDGMSSRISPSRKQDREEPKVKPYVRIEDSHGYISYRQIKKED